MVKKKSRIPNIKLLFHAIIVVVGINELSPVWLVDLRVRSTGLKNLPYKRQSQPHEVKAGSTFRSLVLILFSFTYDNAFWYFLFARRIYKI
jgi:hypothetical protein